MSSFFSWTFRIFSLVFFIIGIYFLAIGLRGLITRKPFLLSARQPMWFMLLCLAPGLAVSLFFLVLLPDASLRRSPLPFLQGLNVLVFVVIVFVFWRQFSGYIAFGVTDESFREALVDSLTQLNIPFQETISRLRLTEAGADLQAAVTGWMGTAQLRIKPRQHGPLLKRIGEAMSDYYRSTAVQVNQTTCAVYATLGVFMIVVAGVFGLWLPDLFSRF